MVTVTCLGLLLTAWLWFSPGVTVSVHNLGSSPLLDLQVHVTGNTCRLGEVPSGAVKKCTLRSTGESDVEISYTLSDGAAKRHTLDCYFESNSRGTVEAHFRDGELVKFDFDN